MKSELAELYQAKAKFESLINQGLDLQEHLRRPEVTPLTPPRQSISDLLNYRLINSLIRDYIALNRQILAESPELAHSLRIKTIDVSTIRLHSGNGNSFERVAEAILGPDPRSLLVHLYWTQKLGVKSIAELTGMGTGTIHKLLDEYHITTRTQSTGVRIISENPAKRAVMTSKIHTADSDQKRAQSMTKFFQAHPDAARRTAAKGAQTKREHSDATIRQIFGDDPATELNRIVYQESLTPDQIIASVNARLAPPTRKLTYIKLISYLKMFNIPANPELRARPKDHFDLIRQAQSQGLIGQLSPREQAVLTARYLTHPPKTLQTLSEELSLTRERIRQIESKSIKNLNDYLSGKSTVIKAASVTRGRPRKNPQANQSL